MTRKPTPRQRMLTDIGHSGLNDADAKKAAYKPIDAKRVKELTGNYAAGYLIPYYDIDGKKTDYWRVRYTEEVKGPFGASKKKPLRYTGPRDALPRFYFPKRVDWRAVANNTEAALAITEGEKKAEKACKAGIPCFSVPGVWAWRSKKQGVSAIPDFDSIKWDGRQVKLCFDNDLMSNPQVIAALNALAHELTGRGAHVFIKFLPNGPGKIGLDDYLVKRSVAAWLKLDEEEFKESAELWALNERLCFVDALASVYDFEAKRFYKSKADLLFVFADRTYMVAKAGDNNGFKEVNGAELWLKWKQKRRYKDLCYAPGEDSVVDDKVNMWAGWGCEPKQGNIKPFDDLLDYLFEGEDELRRWVEQWLAYPIQNPGAKNLTALLLHSQAQGVGKSFLGYIMGEIYGDNFSVIDHEALTSANNGYCVNKQMVLGEEITGGNSRANADRLKNMITRESIYVNIKYQPQYHIQDLCNWLLTSNHDDALFLEARDRRAVVHNISRPPKPFEWYDRIDKWRENGGPSYVFHHLLNDIDLSDYNPKRPAPSTAAKDDMIALSKSDLDLALITLRENPDKILRSVNLVNPCPLLTTTQLRRFINDYTGGRSTLIAVSKALKRAGFRQEKINAIDGCQRVWAVRDTQKLGRLDASEWVAIYNEFQSQKKF